MADNFKQVVHGWAQEMRRNLAVNDANRDAVDEAAFQRSLYVQPSEGEEEQPEEPTNGRKRMTPPKMHPKD